MRVLTGLRCAALGGAALALLLLGPAVRAQSDSWTSPYPLILTPDRALAFLDAAERRLPYVPGEVVIKFRNGMTQTGKERALRVLRARPLVSDLRWAGDLAIWKDDVADVTGIAERLQQQPEVEYAEPNYLYHHHATPNDPDYASRQWNFTAIDLPKAWDINPGSKSSATIAILDTGVTTVNQNFTFPLWDGTTIRNVSIPFAVSPDLNSSRLVGARDFAFWGGPVFDSDGHGTHVASTAGEDTNNNLALAGIAYNARIMPVKVCLSYWDIQFLLSASGFRGFAPPDAGGCDLFAIAQGIRYAADNGAKVINMSLGSDEPSRSMRDALQYAVDHGTFVSVSAGNEFEDGNPVGYPAAYAPEIEGVMAVGAVGRSLTRAYYSSTGNYVEVAAPGGSIRDGGSAGLIWQTTISGADSDPATVIIPRFDRYSETGFQGTSMASPHVAGVASLIMTQGVTKPAAVEELIETTARDLGSTGRDNDFGYGLIQPRAALFGFGVGRNSGTAK